MRALTAEVDAFFCIAVYEHILLSVGIYFLSLPYFQPGVYTENFIDSV